ncbi:tRNA (guanine-N1)-methyltransferase [Gloeothece verrucosa]|uniref:N2N2-dimethylguanosine tRNA methyltransferase n=1 Tax=Gloeothece verrucosa (strain PCC 7822) TaxID=497965 RepID=E0UAM2_GLOV7|nr:tRNA (guanine-N1)-methyltransferase [Gloeothece verrucosa]ADN13874.1 N2N2-dimethylguanosine tRNA methyltransferase [Gloeothece verrucosa PCC 7822]
MLSEGKAVFEVGQAFYRPETRVARDLGVLAAAVYKGDRGSLRVLDAMSGCGVRALRYGLEADADWIWANDANVELQPVLEANLQGLIQSGRAKISHQEANKLLFDCYYREDFYDLVDVDGFGSPAPFLGSALWATKMGGLLYFTSTDGRTATGHLPDISLRVYAAYARCHPSAHEQALRLMIGNVQYHAATRGFGVEPIFSLFTRGTYRVMLRLLSSPCLTQKNYGFLGYCHACGEYKTVSWRSLGRVSCACQNSQKSPVLSGPIWLGKFHEPLFLEKMLSLAKQWGWFERAELLSVMQAEAFLPPYFYLLGEIGKRGKINVPPRNNLIKALVAQGYQATPTHLNPQAIKTNASLAACIELAQWLL